MNCNRFLDGFIKNPKRAAIQLCMCCFWDNIDSLHFFRKYYGVGGDRGIEGHPLFSRFHFAFNVFFSPVGVTAICLPQTKQKSSDCHLLYTNGKAIEFSSNRSYIVFVYISFAFQSNLESNSRKFTFVFLLTRWKFCNIFRFNHH